MTAEEILKTYPVQKIPIEGIGITDFYWKEYVIRAMEAYAQQRVREELIKYSQQYYADEETCIANVREYLNQRKNEKII